MIQRGRRPTAATSLPIPERGRGQHVASRDEGQGNGYSNTMGYSTGGYRDGGYWDGGYSTGGYRDGG